MRFPRRVSYTPSMNRKLVGLVGLAMMMVVWFRLRGGGGRSPLDSTNVNTNSNSDTITSISKEEEVGFVAVNDENEEDFVTSLKTAINTAKLVDNSDFMTAGSAASKSSLSSNNNNNNKYKPSLILHVGPIKSGVQNLAENELSQFQPDFDTDNMVLLPPIDGMHDTCQNELLALRESYAIPKNAKGNKINKKTQSKTKTTMLEAIQTLPCWKGALEILAQYKATNTSVMIADEQLSQQFLPYVDGIGPAVLDWITIRETILVDWKIIVIVSYRRFYEWLPSAKANAEQVHLIPQKESVSPPRLSRWPGERQKGMVLEPLFPHFVQGNVVAKLDVAYTPRLLELYQPFVSEVRVLNLYALNQSVTTTMVCDVLFDIVPTACATSRRRDKDKVEGGGVSWDRLSLVSRTGLLDLKADQLWFDFQLYDELAVTAAKRHYIRTKFVSRSTATETTQYYVEKYRKEVARKDLPLACPKPNVLSKFMEQSIKYERSILPNFIAQNKALIEKDHRTMFANVGNDFCSIHMNKVLKQAEWRAFFRHLTMNSAKRIQAGGEPGTPVRRVRR